MIVKHPTGMHWKRLFPFVCLIVLQIWTGLNAHAVSGEANVSVGLDSTEYLIGDHPVLSIDFEMGEQSNLIWPDFANPGQGLELLNAGVVDTQAVEETLRLSRRIEYIHFDSGSFSFPSLAFLVLSGSDTLVLHSAAIPFRVNTMEIDTAATLKPIKKPMQVEVERFPLWAWGLIGLLALTLIYFVIRWIRGRSKKELGPVPTRVKPSLPPFEHAMQRLGQLENEKLWQQDKIKAYYSELTDILREYIELRFGQPALEETTDQIISELKSRGGIPLVSELESLLMRADLVKFAKALPVAREHEQSMDYARDFLQQSRPINQEERSDAIQKPEEQKSL